MPDIFPAGIKTQNHHINDWFVVPVPVETHKRAITNRYFHRKHVNEWIETYLMLNLDLFGGLFLKAG